MKEKGRAMKSVQRSLFYGVFVAVLAFAVSAPNQANAQSSKWAKEWAKIKAAGQKEGMVIFRTGSSETRKYRQILPTLEKRLGLKIRLLTGSSRRLSVKIVAAKRAGKKPADLWLSGPSSIVNTFVPAGAVQPLQPLLVHPDIKDPSKWVGGKLPWASKWTLAYGARANHGVIVYNPKLVDPNEFTSYWDLLNPKWKGKITMRDPRSNGVQSPRTFLYQKLGKKFYTRLMDEMKPVIAPGARTGVEWVARGKYAFCIIGCNRAAERAERDGISVKAAMPKVLKEGYPIGMGGNGLTAMADPPHPAAAKYFINWFLSREGQIFYQKLTGNYSLRADVPRDDVKRVNMIRPEEKHLHWYGWKFPEARAESQAWLRKMMKKRGY
jgi:iron(III) transport system substrate-binding protein